MSDLFGSRKIVTFKRPGRGRDAKEGSVYIFERDIIPLSEKPLLVLECNIKSY